MDLLNRGAVSDALALLRLAPADRFLEVGFGTGALLRRAARIVGAAGSKATSLVMPAAMIRPAFWLIAAWYQREFRPL